LVAETALILLLSRTCVAEISFQKDTTECELMWSINDRMRGKRSLYEHTLLFNAYWRSSKQRAQRPWIQELDGDEKPEHWPRYLPWKLHLKFWKKYKAAAARFIKTRKWRKKICPKAIDYGGPREYPRQDATRIYCLQGARQWYWARKEKEKLQQETWAARTFTPAYR